MEWVARARITRVQNSEKAWLLPLSFVLGAIVPVVVGMAPAWLGPEIRTAKTHQTILAAWQPDPVWVSWILQGGVYAGTWLSGRSSDTADDSRRKAYRWVCFSYLLAATSSALGHWYVVNRLIGSDREAVGFVRMYVPFPFTGPTGTADNILAQGPWLFLQYDLIIIALSSLSWAFLLLRETGPGRRLPRGVLQTILLVGSVIIGPGATVSLALLVREYHLPISTDSSKKK